VLYRQQFARLHKYLYNSSNWHLVNIDPVSAIYVRDTTTNNALINKAKEMDGDVFIKAPFVKANLPSTIVSKIFNPLYNENNNVPYYDVDIYASDYYSSVGNFNLSEKRLIQALQANNTNYEAIEKLGYNYINKAIVAEDENSKTSLLNKAIEAFQNGINVNPTMPEFYIGIGLSYMQQGKVYDAIPYFTKANDVKPTTKAYNTLADCQNYLMQIDPQNTNTYVRNWFKYMEQSYKLDTKDLLIRYRLGVSYCQRNECDKAKKYIKNHPGGDDFTQEELKQLLTCKDKCGF
jgi:tetratricopeptide (TPR) repeat protein